MRIHAVINAVLVLKHLRSKKKFGSFLRLLQVKCGILTRRNRLLESVVVAACVSKPLHMGSIRCHCGGTISDWENAR